MDRKSKKNHLGKIIQTQIHPIATLLDLLQEFLKQHISAHRK